MATPPLYCLIWSSLATDRFAESMLVPLVERGLRANNARGITGVLMYFDGHFVEAVEGQQDYLQKLMRKLERDPRHHDIQVLLERQIAQRAFPDWCLHLARPGPSDLASADALGAWLRHGELDATPVAEVTSDILAMAAASEPPQMCAQA